MIRIHISSSENGGREYGRHAEKDTRGRDMRVHSYASVRAPGTNCASKRRLTIILDSGDDTAGAACTHGTDVVTAPQSQREHSR